MQQATRATTRPAAERLKPVIDPAAWTKEELARSTDWIHVLTQSEIADLDRTIAAIEAQQIRSSTSFVRISDCRCSGQCSKRYAKNS